MNEQIMQTLEQTLASATEKEVDLVAKAYAVYLPKHLNSTRHKANFILETVENRLN